MPRPRMLVDAIGIGVLIQAECRNCGKRAFYLPEDLARLGYSEARRIETLPFSCTTCLPRRMMMVSVRPIDQRDAGKLIVRRPRVGRGPTKWYEQPVRWV